MGRGKLVKPLSKETLDKFTEQNRQQDRSGHPWKAGVEMRKNKDTREKACIVCKQFKRLNHFAPGMDTCRECMKQLHYERIPSGVLT